MRFAVIFGLLALLGLAAVCVIAGRQLVLLVDWVATSPAETLPVHRRWNQHEVTETHVFVEISKGLFSAAGLTKNSRAMCEQIVSVEKSRLVEPVLGTIPSTLMTALVAALRRAVE